VYVLWSLKQGGYYGAPAVHVYSVKEDAAPVQEYTVTFNADGKISQTTVKAGDKAAQPADPYKAGYVFDGWRAGGADGPSYDFNAPVVADLTLFAGFYPENSVMINVTSSASVAKLGGGQNILTITVTEIYSDNRTIVLTETYTIVNNAASLYKVEPYIVYVDTKGNTQVRECYIMPIF